MPNLVTPMGRAILAGLQRASGPQIQLSNASFPAGSAQATGIGTLSVTGGTGAWVFSLTDSAGSKAQVAGTNGVNLQAGSASALAGSFSITVSATNGVLTISRTFLITAIAASSGTPIGLLLALTTTAGGAPPTSTAGSPAGLLLSLTKAA